ncbi:MAG TPA: adenosine deaminase family protein [Candidatus Binatia bacterium]|nr:adenosine deaminase family protein [Candidatus Binatia bacterium]
MAPGTLAERIPKIHLHCHLEGCLRAPTFVELAAKHGVPLRYRRDSSVILSFDSARDRLSAQDDTRRAQDDNAGDPYAFEGLEEFLLLFAAVSRALCDPEDYALLAREFVEDALAQNVIYGELFVSPSVWTFFNPQLDVRAAVEAIATELRKARPRATFKLLADVTRNFGAESALATTRAMAAMTDLDVIGIALGGDEARFPARLFADVFAYARAQGLHCVAHAGEADGPASVRDALELLHAERIGHGIRALEHPATVETLAQRRIPLEICPTSNRLTGAELAGHPHPHVEFDQFGCVVTIDCDDPAIFGTTLREEYAIVERTAGPEALQRYVRNAIHASFAGEGEKRAMEARLTAAIAELHAGPRS